MHPMGPFYDALEHLQALVKSGEFHHVTYRCLGTVWEGYWFYRKSDTGYRGFEVAGCVNKTDPNLDKATEFLIQNGIATSVGSYGNG